ncbi:hypothetical protein [Nocardioides abyssi]|uniref:DUF2567 domain-containing protein n=1 Tax=Nocardioides abyssi TaxID=3058370 RepID=A0ABT8ESH0_9ACTN|nr:hypothetical protein [Nocardioides abyssi]MDN4161100.1 hypothetical protein [Nocardioides abyssi]
MDEKAPSLRAVVVTAMIGALAAAVLWTFVLFAYVFPRQWATSPGSEAIDALFWYAAGATLVLLATLLAVNLRWNARRDIHVAQFWVGVGLGAGGVAAVALTATLAENLSFATTPLVVAVEVAVAAALVTGGVAAGASVWLHAADGPVHTR